MRKAFKPISAAPSQIECFVTLLNSTDFKREAAAVLLMDGTLLRFNPDKTDFKFHKGNVFCGKERIRAVLLMDKSALALEGGQVVAQSVDDLIRFIRDLDKPKASEPVVEVQAVSPPASDKIKSAKSEEELALYRRIVSDLDQNAFGEYIKQKRMKLLKFASKNEHVAEEALQMTMVSVLEMMEKCAKGERKGFCQTPEYFDSWFHSVLNSKVYKFIKNNKKHAAAFSIASGEAAYEDSYGISEETLQDSYKPEGIAAYHGHEDPLGFFVRHEDFTQKVRAVNALMVMAQTNVRIEMLLRSSAKIAGVGDQFEGEIKSAEYAELANEHGIPIGTVRSRIYRGRSDALDFLKRLGIGEVKLAQKISAVENNVLAVSDLMPEPR